VSRKKLAVAAVFFDLDGVLIDSMHLWFRLVNATAKAFDHPPVEWPAFESTWGQGVAADIQVFFQGNSVDEIESYYAAHFLDFIDHLKVDRDAEVVMSRLVDHGFHTAVITNTPAVLATMIVQHSGLSPELVVGATEVIAAKPAPDMILLACAWFELAPSDSVLLGDSRFDEEAAAQAGANHIGYRYPAQRRIDTLVELFDQLELHEP